MGTHLDGTGSTRYSPYKGYRSGYGIVIDGSGMKFTMPRSVAQLGDWGRAQFESPDVSDELALALPPYVLSNHMMDALQGRLQRLHIAQLQTEGLSRLEAKAVLCPPYRGGPYLQVWRKSVEEPVVNDYGGTGFKDEGIWKNQLAPESFLRPFMAPTALCRALLGISTANGGAGEIEGRKNFMLLSTEAAAVAQRFVAQHQFHRLRDPKLFCVLLHIGKEAPNLLCPDEHTVWASSDLKARTSMLVSLGNLIGAYLHPGGFGTREERARIRTDNQLDAHIVTSIDCPVGCVYVDYRMCRGGNYWDAAREDDRRMKGTQSIAPKHLDHDVYVDAFSSDGYVKGFMHSLATLQRMANVSPLSWWEQVNGTDFWKTVKKLLPEFLTQYDGTLKTIYEERDAHPRSLSDSDPGLRIAKTA